MIIKILMPFKSIFCHKMRSNALGYQHKSDVFFESRLPETRAAR